MHNTNRRPRKGAVLGDLREADPIARQLLAACPDRLNDLTDHQLDDLERAAAGVLGAIEHEYDRRAKRELGNPHPGEGPWNDGSGHEQRRPGARWADHMYQLTQPEEGRTFVAEPYNLAADDLRDLVSLADQGWKVTVTGHTRHYPNVTVGVHLRQ